MIMIEIMNGLCFRERISEVIGPSMLLPNIKYPTMPTKRYRGNCSSSEWTGWQFSGLQCTHSNSITGFNAIKKLFGFSHVMVEFGENSMSAPSS